MAIRSHSDIIEFFKNEVTRIKAEIDRLEMGLVFFTESQEKPKMSEKPKPANSTPLASGKKTRKPRQKKPLEIPDTYNSSLT